MDGSADRPRAAGALARFHLVAGVRLCLRVMVPLGGAVALLAGIQADPGAFLVLLARGVACAPADPFFVVGEAMLSMAMAAWAAPRLTAGLEGWIRHLPAAGSAHRLAVILGLAAAQTPLTLAVVLLAAGIGASGTAIALMRIAGLPLMALGAAWAAIPVQRRMATRVLGTMAAVAGASGDWRLLLAGLGALALAGRVAGRIRLRAPERWIATGSGRATSARLSGRALGWRRLGLCLVALLPLAGSTLLIANNHLEGTAASRAVRLGGAMSVALLCAGMGDLLARRRPAWPWLRSLPWSSRQRVGADTIYIGLHAGPLLLLTALVDWRAAVAVAAATPLLSARASGLIRTGMADRVGPWGRMMVEGFIVSGLICLLPWSALGALAATPLALGDAARRDRKQKMGRWLELHHLAAGDSLSWTGR